MPSAVRLAKPLRAPRRRALAALAFVAAVAKKCRKEDRAMLDFAMNRRRMVDNQIRTADVTHRPLLAAFDELPREHFVPEAVKPFAYSDRHLELGQVEASGETRYAIAPVLLARLLQAVEPAAGAKALHVACGTAYGSAILARLGASVIGLEQAPGLVAAAEAALSAAGVSGVKLVSGPLAEGAATEGPFDIVIIEGSYQKEPARLLAQLAEGGRLIGIEGVGRAAEAMLHVKAGGVVAGRPIFDAAAPLLAAFAADPQFAF
jgi:protein-L-isoaspartate(D-aspartate) O-methyltransferase